MARIAWQITAYAPVFAAALRSVRADLEGEAIVTRVATDIRSFRITSTGLGPSMPGAGLGDFSGTARVPTIAEPEGVGAFYLPTHLIAAALGNVSAQVTISVAGTDCFMKILMSDGEYTTVWPGGAKAATPPETPAA